MTQSIAIIDYGSGNLRSVEKAFERARDEMRAAAQIDVTDDPARIAEADRLVLPGVGAFAACREGLLARPGVLEAMEHNALVLGRPFLGICVGMQLLAETGLEFGAHDGLDWIPGQVVALPNDDPDHRSPHMGWNDVLVERAHPVLDGSDRRDFYFAHSYSFVPENAAHVLAYVAHGGPLVAAVGRDNVVGLQFHPEKSQSAGIAVLRNFLNWTPV